jgi:hypothetical protein
MRFRHRPTPEARNDGRQTGSTYISSPKTDRYAVPTAIPGFSVSPNSAESAPASVDVGNHQTGISYISRSTTDRQAVPTTIHIFSGSPDSTESLPISADVDRYRKRKMATAKPELVLSHVL